MFSMFHQGQWASRDPWLLFASTHKCLFYIKIRCEWGDIFVFMEFVLFLMLFTVFRCRACGSCNWSSSSLFLIICSASLGFLFLCSAQRYSDFNYFTSQYEKCRDSTDISRYPEVIHDVTSKFVVNFNYQEQTKFLWYPTYYCQKLGRGEVCHLFVWNRILLKYCGSCGTWTLEVTFVGTDTQSLSEWKVSDFFSCLIVMLIFNGDFVFPF